MRYAGLDQCICTDSAQVMANTPTLGSWDNGNWYQVVQISMSQTESQYMDT